MSFASSFGSNPWQRKQQQPPQQVQPPIDKDADVFLDYIGAGGPKSPAKQQQPEYRPSPPRADDSERRRAEKLEAEVIRLREALEAEKRRWETERRSINDQVRAEVERRLYEEQESSRRHIATLNEEIQRLHTDARHTIEKLVSENTSLQRELDDVAAPGGYQTTASTAPHQGMTMDISDLFPMGLAGVQLGSLTRPEWRQLFQQLLAEMVRRKRAARMQRLKRRRTRRQRSPQRVSPRWRVRMVCSVR